MKPTVSLTFDDGLSCQLEVATWLAEQSLRATFFLPVATKQYPLNQRAWQIQADRNHEIGSHSRTHQKAAEYRQNISKRNEEIAFSKTDLETLFHTSIKSFCYPYTDAFPELQNTVRTAGYLQARGGRGAREDKVLVPGDGANLFNVPAYHVGPYTVCDAGKWAEEVTSKRGWLTLMFHGVGSSQDWDNISFIEFKQLVKAFQDQGVRIETFAKGGDLYRDGRD